MYEKILKRLLDIVFSFVGIVVLFVPMIIIIAVIRFDSKGRALFPQTRVGIHKRQFKIYKFRTMYINTPENVPTRKFRDAEKWITKPGRFLRKTSLDELPQLLNILRGDMSFVGPRPVIPDEIDLITERDNYGANDVLPGLTGWAQVNGRDELDIFRKSQLDGEYVKELKRGIFYAVKMDLKCVLKTVKSVIKKEGVLEGGENIEAESKEKEETNV